MYFCCLWFNKYFDIGIVALRWQEHTQSAEKDQDLIATLASVQPCKRYEQEDDKHFTKGDMIFSRLYNNFQYSYETKLREDDVFVYWHGQLEMAIKNNKPFLL